MNAEFLWKEKISKLLLKQSTPAIIWMVAMALYNLVDTIFVGRGVGTEAIAAVSIVLPIQMIIWAFAMALWIGASSVISRRLWEWKYSEVSKVFGTFQTTNILVWILLSVLLFVFSKPLLMFFGSTTDILELGHEYFSVLLVGVVFFCFNMWNNHVIRSVWHAKVSMIVMISSSLLNVFLDWLFIFPLKMWVWWAAWATVISWILGSIIVLRYFFSKHNIIKTKISDFKIRIKRLKEIVSIWLASFSRQISGSVIAIFVNNLLWLYGWALAIAAYGIVNRALTVFMMPMFGIIQWMQPILGYNHWAWYKNRVKEVTLLSVKILTIFTIAVFAISMAFPGLLLNIFSTDLDLLNMAIPAMRILILMFPLVGFQVVASGFYQSLWKAWKALLFSLLRQIVILIPILYILPKMFELNGVRYSFPISDFLAAIVIFIVFRRDLKKIKTNS